MPAARPLRIGVAVAVLLMLLPTVPRPPAQAAVVLDGFQIATVWSGLSTPTALAFAPNGRVFVAERSGIIKTFDSVGDSTPTVAADLRANVHSVGDRGLLGLAVDPGYPARPYVYVSYIADALPGGTTPHYNDTCPLNDGHKDGCPAPGRVSRLTMSSGGTMVGAEAVLIGGTFWCHQQQGHALDHLAFGPDGALYASSGDGGTASFTDWGQHFGSVQAVAPNACGDPPGPAGTRLSLPTTEGGALRSQDLRTSSDPAGGSGAIVRFSPDTGAALPTNPLIGGDPSDDRHVAYGLRNPFRFTFRPGTSEVWVGDVGWNSWEELNLIASPTSAPPNFGWPCYEGAPRQPQFDGVNVTLCENLYAAGSAAVAQPYWAYRHDQSPDPARCGNAGSALSALAFAESPPYPAMYDGALFLGDYVKACLWVMRPGADGRPNPATIETLATAVAPVDLDAGPDGRLYYVDIGQGRVSRIDYFSANSPPIARASATPTAGPVPLEVEFDGTQSTDADGPAPLAYAWDLDGDGAFDDATAATATWTYGTSATVQARLRVTDGLGEIGIDTVEIQAGNTLPSIAITAPSSSHHWTTGEEVTFAGTATDAEDGYLTDSIQWSLVLFHCQTATDCHEHPQEETVGAGGTFEGPEHEYPAYLELRASVRDSRGALSSTSVRLDPRTVQLQVVSDPPGLQLLAGSTVADAPFTVTAISGSPVSVTAPPTQVTSEGVYAFSSWSDGGAASHEFLTGAQDETLTAHYVRSSAGWAPVGTGPLAAATTASTPVAYPTGLHAGDLLLLGCQGRNNAADWTAPGFGSLSRSSLTAGLRLEVLSAWASGSESGSLTVTNAGPANGWSCALSAFRGGPGSGSPLHGAAVQAAGRSALMTAPAMGTTPSGALVTHWYASLDDNDHGSPSAGETLAFGGTAYHTVIGVDHAASMAYRVAPTTGPVGSATMQQRLNAIDTWSTITLAFVPGSTGPSNAPPTATPQSVETDEDEAVLVGLSGSDPDGDPLTFRITVLPAHGSLYVGDSTAPGDRLSASDLPASIPGAQVTYLPTLDEHGDDAFTFEASDGQAADSATIAIHVHPMADSPTAANDSYATGTDQTLVVGASGGVLANDHDPDGEPLAAILVGDVENGVLALATDGSFSYTPATGFTGTDEFTYQAEAGGRLSPLATVTISVTATPPPPAGWAPVGTGPLAAATTASTPVAYPTGLHAGDLLLLGCQGRNNAADWTAPGFGSLSRSSLTAGLRLEVLSAWASGSESGSLTVTNAGPANGWSCALSAFRGGPGSGSPLHGAAVQAAGRSALMTAPAMGTTPSGALVTHWYASLDDNDHGSPSAGETLAFGGTAYHTVIGVDHAASMAYRVAPTTGPVGSATMQQRLNAIDTWSTITLAFVPGSGH